MHIDGKINLPTPAKAVEQTLEHEPRSIAWHSAVYTNFAQEIFGQQNRAKQRKCTIKILIQVFIEIKSMKIYLFFST